MRASIRLGLIAVVGTLLGLAAMAIDHAAGARLERLLIPFVVGETYLLGGSLAWSRDPSNRTWGLMVGVGIGWFLGDLAGSPNPMLHAIGVAFADTDAIFLTALVLAYPTGALEFRTHRGTVLVAAVGLTAANVIALVTGDATLNLVLGLALTAAVAVLVPRRWVRASSEERPLLAPAVLATTITLLAIAIAIGVRLANVPDETEDFLVAVRDLGALAIPIGFVVGSFQLAHAQLRRSRARIVEAGDVERRRLERDLHDGAQQRLVTSAIALRTLRSQLGTAVDPALETTLDTAASELRAGIAELRELAQGIHPAALSAGGLAAALPTLVERSAVPVALKAVPDGRFPEAIETAAFFVASEALANVAKHASATRATVDARLDDGRLRIEIADDGVGGADPRRGTGMTGLADRLAAVDGELTVDSPVGGGTRVVASIPLPDEFGLAPLVQTGSAGDDDRDGNRRGRR